MRLISCVEASSFLQAQPLCASRSLHLNSGSRGGGSRKESLFSPGHQFCRGSPPRVMMSPERGALTGTKWALREHKPECRWLQRALVPPWEGPRGLSVFRCLTLPPGRTCLPLSPHSLSLCNTLLLPSCLGSAFPTKLFQTNSKELGPIPVLQPSALFSTRTYLPGDWQ